MTSPRICVSITEHTVGEAIESIKQVEAQKPDLIEVRLDHISKPLDFQRLRRATDIPMIATNRRKDQGGRSVEPEDDRKRALLEACSSGFEYVDLELTSDTMAPLVQQAKDLGCAVIVSYHDLCGTPSRENLEWILRKELSEGADICKIVGVCHRMQDNLTYLDFITEHRCMDLVSFGMGEEGHLSRIFSPLFGGSFTYASTEDGKEAAPGQLSIVDLRAVYRILGV